MKRPAAPIEVCGHPVRFTRRRYGKATYTWASVLIDNEWKELGDPWPGINWKRRELEKSVALAVKGEQP